MSKPKLTPDFSKWLGLQMIPAKNDPTFFRSEDCGGILLTEVTIPETYHKKRKEFWSVFIRVENYEATGNDYDRAEARAEAFGKLRERVFPLIQKLGNLELLTPVPKIEPSSIWKGNYTWLGRTLDVKDPTLLEFENEAIKLQERYVDGEFTCSIQMGSFSDSFTSPKREVAQRKVEDRARAWAIGACSMAESLGLMKVTVYNLHT